MEEYEKFRQMSLGAFSCDSLSLLGVALSVIQRRYPNAIRSLATNGSVVYPSLEDISGFEVPMPHTAPEWIGYTFGISLLPPIDGGSVIDGSNIKKSIWHLARGDCVEQGTVEAYLKLLRPKSLSTQILKVRNVQDVIEIQDEGLDRPTIIPFQRGDNWAFAVAYSDCIHWYNSSEHNDIPTPSTRDSRSVVTCWTGPRQLKPEDSGIFMLLGIRCIQQGTPHLSQRAADAVASSFRDRIIIELLCEKIDPSDDDFQEFLRQDEEQSLFVHDAINTTDPRPHEISVTPPHIPESCTTQDVASPSVVEESSWPCQSSTPTPERSLSRSLSVASCQAFPDLRRDILQHLSEAAFACRSMRASTANDLVVLWQSMKRGRIGSTLHERYNAVLFCDKMNQLRGDNDIDRATNYQIDQQCIKAMRSMQSRCKFWRDLCDLRREWETGKYALLLAIPDIPTRKLQEQKDQLLCELSSRLENRVDPLGGWLQQAQSLCSAIVSHTLPKENLMIDLYHLKQYEPMTDSAYQAFMSLDPQAKVPIPRARSSSQRTNSTRARASS